MKYPINKVLIACGFPSEVNAEATGVKSKFTKSRDVNLSIYLRKRITTNPIKKRINTEIKIIPPTPVECLKFSSPRKIKKPSDQLDR